MSACIYNSKRFYFYTCDKFIDKTIIQLHDTLTVKIPKFDRVFDSH